MTLSFDPTSVRPGVEIRDHIERRTYALHTSSVVSPTPTDDDFRFPVDAAVSVTTDAVTLPSFVATYVRDADGEMRLQVRTGTDRRLPEGAYRVEVCAPMKLYLAVDGPVSVTASDDRIRFEFESETEVGVGARSHHERPAATVTTTEDPRDVMTALSTLGSALKTTSPERSFPTLRGHPPLVEVGRELRVPDELDVPETGVRIELPPDRGHAYVAAPLAFYLGAELVPGSTPRIVTDDGFEHALDGPQGFEEAVARTLKQTFLLDCVTRTEGYYPVTLHEREAVEPHVDLDFADLYDRTLAERLDAYLSVPFEVVAEFVPTWKLTTHVDPTPENVESIPFLVDDLAVVRTPDTRQTTAQRPTAAVGEVARDGESSDEFTRSTAGSSETFPLVEPERTDSVEQAWLGDHAPVDASKATPTAFRNRLERETDDDDIEIAVVCNDTAMDEERDIAAEVYGSRENLPFDVTVHRDLTVERLRDVLAEETAFLHYIGHIDDNGFECADGYLDAADVEDVGAEAFMLNACQSYDQGMALVDAGSVGGVVTLSDVINSGAVRVGKTMVRLLNRGFPLRAAMSIARGRSIVGNQYIVVGDGNHDVVQTESGVAVLCVIDTGDGDDEFEVTLRSYVSGEGGMGGFFTPLFGDADRYHLTSGEHGPFSLTTDELRTTLALEDFPVEIDGKFEWSNSIDLDAY
ncbi:caspase family protein [Halorussus salinisoli]|uniref:caspase family protein n=1 Tax=Halorussus salinisoli TaxID=2558242 RepID=UPI0010C1BC55|nr:caspase family protein [Halorussus salinisoli]